MCNIPYSKLKDKIQILITTEFSKWLNSQQPKIRAIVISRLDLLSEGHFGNYKKFEGLIELRWKNGIRIYSFMKNNSLIIVVNGGNKNGQSYDIKKAKKIKEEIINGTRSV